MLIKQSEFPLYHIEHRNYIDDDGELRSVVQEYWRCPQRNIDTFQVQEAFLANLSPQVSESIQPISNTT